MENNASREMKIVDGAPLVTESKSKKTFSQKESQFYTLYHTIYLEIDSCMAKRVLRSQHQQLNSETSENSSQIGDRSEKPEKLEKAVDKTDKSEKNENAVPPKKEEIQNRLVFLL